MIWIFNNKKGSALIMALICMLLLTAMVGAMIQVSTSSFQYQKSEFSRIKGEYLSAETVERYRRELLENFRQEGMGPSFFVEKVREMLESETPEPGYHLEDEPQTYRLLDYTADAAAAETVMSTPVRAWISGVSEENSSAGSWVELIGEVTINGVNVQSRIRISFAPPSIYELAILTKTVDCMCCHLEVNGDMGTIGDFRPGWGSETGGGKGSGDHSILNGNLYSSGGYQDDSSVLKNALRDASDSTSKSFSDYFLSGDKSSNLQPRNGDDYSIPEKIDPDEPFLINSMTFNGDIFVEDSAVGRKLPEREEANAPRQFPTLDIPMIQEQAEGKIASGGSIYTGTSFPDLSASNPDGTVIWSVPIDESSTFDPSDSSQNLGKNSTALNQIEGYLDSHIILVGTKENPIQLNGDLVVEGDVILKGYVEGRGTLYSGGNIYLAGDVIYADAGEYDPFRKADLNSDGEVTDEEKNEHAQELIANEFSELRLGARNNIVIGDWTYTDNTSDSPETFYGNETFLKSQFNTNQNTFFVKGTTGEEVTYNDTGDDGAGYYNDRGELIPSDNVQKYQNNAESYRAVFGTTYVKSDGSLHNWMEQSDYRRLLFSQAEQYQSASYVVGTGDKASDGKYGEELREHLTKNGLPEEMVDQIVNNINPDYNDSKSSDEGDWAWRQDIVDGGRDHNVITIMIDEPTKPIRADVGRIDAYLYASRRIAGHIYGKDLVINGGMIAEQIGVLAPGRRDFEWLPSRYGEAFRDEGDDSDLSDIWFIRNDWYGDERSGRGGKLTVNYDYRLKNGGQSYDLLADAGTIIFWDKSVSRK